MHGEKKKKNRNKTLLQRHKFKYFNFIHITVRMGQWGGAAEFFTDSDCRARDGQQPATRLSVGPPSP